MAVADCVISAGVRVAALPYKAGSADCVVRCGLAVAAPRVAWAGSRAPKEKMDWLPRADEVWIDPKTGRPTRRFYQFLREIAEVRLGGVQGTTVPQVQTTVTQTQATVTATVSYAALVGQYAQGVAAATEATTQVLQAAGTTGSESIPEVPDPPLNPKLDTTV